MGCEISAWHGHLAAFTSPFDNFMGIMRIKEHYQKADLQTLVETIETPDDYTDEAVEAAINELESREVDDEDVRLIALNILTQKARGMLQSFSPVNDELTLPTSYFLKRDEVVKIFKREFDAHVERRQQMTPDSWSYVIGAGL